MLGRRLLTLLTLATATTALAAVPAGVCQPQMSADHACCRVHQDHASAERATACHDPHSSPAGAAALHVCACLHEPAAPAEQARTSGQAQAPSQGLHATHGVVPAVPAHGYPVQARPLRVREAAGPPLYTLTCALLI